MRILVVLLAVPMEDGDDAVELTDRLADAAATTHLGRDGSVGYAVVTAKEPRQALRALQVAAEREAA